MGKKQKKKYDLRKEYGTTADKLIMILDQGVAGSTIYLPPREIKLPSIRIKKPFKILGEPGTLLLFDKTTLTFEFPNSEIRHQNEDINFREAGFCLFSQVQFCFLIDLKEIAYRSSGSNTKQDIPMRKTDSSGRTKIPLIVVGAGSKIEFRDCSFRSYKKYKKSASPKLNEKAHKKSNSNVSNR